MMPSQHQPPHSPDERRFAPAPTVAASPELYPCHTLSLHPMGVLAFLEVFSIQNNSGWALILNFF